MNNSSRQIKYGALLSYTSIALNILAGLIYTPWMIEKIGQSQYGLYTLCNSLISLFLMDFGLSSATARYLSRYRATGEDEKINDFLGAIYKLYLIIDAVIFLAFAVVYFRLETIYVSLTPEELAQLKVVYLVSASFSLVNFPFVTLNGILTAYERFIPLKLADIIHKVLVIILMVAALLRNHGLFALVTVNAVAGLLITLYKLIVIKRTVPARINWRHSDKSLYREIFGFSLWSTVAALAQRLIFNITPSILGILCNSGVIAVFGVIATIEGYAYMISGAINGLFMPKVSRIYAGQDTETSIFPLLMSVGRIQYTLNGLIIAGFAVIGREFLILWMGPAYLDAYAGILLVIIPNLFFNSLQIANTAIVVTKHVSYFACINVIMGLTNVLLAFPLVYHFGMIGSCISIFIAYMLRAVLLNILYRRKLQIDLKTFAKECYCKLAVPILVTIGLGLWITGKVPANGWAGLAVKGCIVVVVYAGMVVLLQLRSIRNWLRHRCGIREK